MVNLLNPDLIKVILDTSDTSLLNPLFAWRYSPEGDTYWHSMYESKKLTNETRIKLLKMYQEHVREKDQ